MEFGNLVLASLDEADAERLTAGGTRVELAFGRTLQHPGDRVEWVHFPERSLISITKSTRDGQLTEAGMVGFEGASGLVEACGSRTAAATSIVQASGPAWRVRAADCQALLERSARLSVVLLRAAEFQLIESRQSVLCRSFHMAEARLARWLLECRDRSGHHQSLSMTQEFLAAMLGVRRTTVTAFAAELQHRDLIRLSRGKVEFIDVEGLEQVACECRSVLVGERARLNGA